MKCEAAALSYNLYKYTNINLRLRGLEAKNLSPKGICTPGLLSAVLTKSKWWHFTMQMTTDTAADIFIWWSKRFHRFREIVIPFAIRLRRQNLELSDKTVTQCQAIGQCQAILMTDNTSLGSWLAWKLFNASPTHFGQMGKYFCSWIKSTAVVIRV